MQTKIMATPSLADLIRLAKELDQADAPYVLVLGDEESVRRQAAGIRCLVSDVDDTLTLRRGWAIMREQLPPELRAADERFLNAFLEESRKAPTPELIAAEEGAWVAVDVQFMAEARWTRADVWSLAEGMGMRPGVPAFFNRFTERCLVSFGLKDVIDRWLAVHDLKVRWVYATSIVFKGTDEASPSDRVGHADPMSVTTSSTKGEHVREFLHVHGVDLSSVLAIGDDPKVDGRLWRPEHLNVLVKPPNGPIKADRLGFSTMNLKLFASGIDALNDYLDAVS